MGDLTRRCAVACRKVVGNLGGVALMEAIPPVLDFVVAQTPGRPTGTDAASMNLYYVRATSSAAAPVNAPVSFVASGSAWIP